MNPTFPQELIDFPFISVAAKKGVNAGMIAGITIGGLVALIITVIVVYKVVDYYRWQKWLKENDMSKNPWDEEEEVYQYPVTDRYAQEKLHHHRGRRSPVVTPAPMPDLARDSSIITVSSMGSISKKPLPNTFDEDFPESDTQSNRSAGPGLQNSSAPQHNTENV